MVVPKLAGGHTQGRWVPALARVFVRGWLQAAREEEAARKGTHSY